MHMSDALLSPGIGLAFGAASGAALAYSAHKVKTTLDDHLVPLMGVLGAFVFAAQMINFTIPGTGSSGHLGGGLLLVVLLGPHAALLTLSSVLVVQSLFFADGGVLALGTNIFNLGLLPAVIGWPLFRVTAGKKPSPARITLASTLAALCVLELGALGLVGETFLSGRSELPFGPFLILMLGIHLPIALVEGLVTAAVVSYLYKLRPEIANRTYHGVSEGRRRRPLTPLIASLAAAALLTGGVAAWFASSRPDGLEWSLRRLTGSERPGAAEYPLAKQLAGLQERSAILADYRVTRSEENAASDAEVWPRVDPETTLSGLAGAVFTLALAGLLGLFLVRRRRDHPKRGRE